MMDLQLTNNIICSLYIILSKLKLNYKSIVLLLLNSSLAKKRGYTLHFQLRIL